MEIRALHAHELEQAWELDRESFHAPADRREHFLALHEPGRVLGAFEAGRLLAMWAVIGFGQFFGGRAVPMGGVSSVAVVADQRGYGLAPRLARASLPAMRERGEVISSLFPATSRLYRGLGWELAGACSWRSLAPASLGALPRPSGMSLRPLEERDFDAVRRCYDELAAPINGFLERGARGWRAHRERWRRSSAYVAEDAAGAVAGWVVHRRLDGGLSALGGPFQLALDDVGWATRDAGLAIWRLLGSWATQVERIVYRGGPEDPLLRLAPEQALETLAEVRWMTRVVDAPGAVAARGFPEGLSLAVPFELEDALVPENCGAWRLCVEDGRGVLERGGSGGVRLDVGAFSSLYTGWSTTAALARAGRLAGGSAAELRRLDAAFGGPTPWMMDEF